MFNALKIRELHISINMYVYLIPSIFQETVFVFSGRMLEHWWISGFH